MDVIFAIILLIRGSTVFMKKILISIIVLALTSISCVNAEDIAPQDLDAIKKKKITFIYINGSNDNSSKDRLEFRESFEKDVKAMHPYMLKAFNEDPLVRTKLLKDGEFELNEEPVTFYWGDKSFAEIENLDNKLSLSSIFSPRLSKLVRTVFAHCLHDAVWVQKYSNMSMIIDELHRKVKYETDKGNQVVLLGYSAGSFITYEYFLNKFISIDPAVIVNGQEYEKMKKLLGEEEIKPTCLDALLESEIVTLDMTGKYKANSDKQLIFKNYPLLNEKTQTTCFKDGSVRGVINFASPLSLFYSEVSDTKSDLNFLSKLMYRHILESGVFWLTVNYAEDPLGFPTSKNISLEELNKISVVPINPKGGFVYDVSNVRSRKSFITAHMAYWHTQKRFVKAIINAYNKGYENMYKTGNPESI